MSNIKKIKKNLKEKKADTSWILAGIIGVLIGFALCFITIEIITLL